MKWTKLVEELVETVLRWWSLHREHKAGLCHGINLTIYIFFYFVSNMLFYVLLLLLLEHG